MADQAGRVAYAHGTAFTSEALEAYAAEVGGRSCRSTTPAIYPVSGGSEAIETALKMARAYHLARGEADREVVIARWGSYHGNTLGALDLSGRQPLRRPYEAVAGPLPPRLRRLPVPGRRAAARTRSATADELAAELDRAIEAAGPGTVAAFVAEPIVGATLGAVVPPDGYWPAIAEVCRRHGVLLIADEVMTGFGRTGPLVRDGPLGRPAGHPGRRQGRDVRLLAVRVRGRVRRRSTRRSRRAGFVHGFTFSHSIVGRGRRPRGPPDPPRRRTSSAASAAKGERLRALLATRLGDHPHVGEIRGRGLMVGLELVADRATRAPFPRAAAADRGASSRPPASGASCVYSGTGSAERRRRRLDPPRAAVRDDRRGAGADRRRRGRRRSRRRRRRPRRGPRPPVRRGRARSSGPQAGHAALVCRPVATACGTGGGHRAPAPGHFRRIRASAHARGRRCVSRGVAAVARGRRQSVVWRGE